MALDFPSSPTLNQTYTLGTKTWVWKGSGWEVQQVAGVYGNFNINTLSSSSETGGGSATFDGTAYRFTLSYPPASAAQLLVSLNGVVQKPNSGTGQPAEGFAVDGNDIIFSEAPVSGSDFFIVTSGSSVNIGTPSDNSVTSAKIVDGTIVNSDISTSADIAGTKVNPDFGSQNISTTGVYIHGIGSASSPTITFSGDTNTGVYSPGADQVGISTGGNLRAVFDSAGRCLVGTSTSRGVGGNIQSNLQIEGTGTGSDTTSCSVFQNSNTADGPRFMLAKSRSTSNGGVTLVQSDDSLGIIDFAGADGTDAGTSAVRISAQVDGTPGSNDMPGRLIFATTADGAASPTTRMTIRADGQVEIPDTYSITTTNAANLFISTSGFLRRSTSSVKYKTNIETLEDSYADVVLNCRPVWYRSTTGNDNPEHGYWGFIAEEVAEIDPRLVFWKITESVVQEDGSRIDVPCDPEPEGVQYDRFVPHLLNLIKRQKQQIEAMEARLSALEAS